MKKYDIIVTVIIVALVISSLAGIFLLYNISVESKEFDYLKNYQDNEYMPVYIDDEKMAKMYHTEFEYYLTKDLKGLYDHLNPRYREKRFKSYNTFQLFALTYTGKTIESYRVTDRNDKKIFYIKLSDGLEVIFATSGVMKYEIYFDDQTVTIE